MIFSKFATHLQSRIHKTHNNGIQTGFTIPPNYSAKQIYHSLKSPAWTWDFLSNEPYKYACINTEVPADSLAAFVNSQINPAFSWEDAVSWQIIFICSKKSISNYLL